MSPDLWRPPLAIAHRGSRLLWPENTMTAFSGAVSLGLRHIETDIHITRDDVLVCHHDPTVDRTTDGTGRVGDLTFDEISSLDAGYRHVGLDGHVFRGEGVRVPSLEEALLGFPETGFVIDLKCDGLEGPLHEMIERLGAHDRLIVGSVSDLRLRRFRSVSDARVATSTGSRSSRSWLIASRIGRGGRRVAAALQLPLRSRGVRVVDRRLIDAAHARGLQVHVWTVNDPIEMHRVLDLGADGIITDRPDLLRAVLIERGVATNLRF